MFEHFDPDAPAEHDGLFGLPHARHDARVLVVPVPMDATTSFGQGTAHAPSAVLTASHQVDLSLPEFGDPWRAGIAMDAAPPGVESDCALAAANAPLARKGDTGALHRVNAASERIAHALYEWTNGVLTSRQIPAVLGGDHSVPLGAIRAAASHQPGLGILHIDAHADLREAYEGFEQSHASIMYNVLQDTNVANILQIGLRDVGQREREFAEREDRLRWLTDAEIRRRTHRGEPMSEILLDGLQHLPETLWISFDVDGLDPSLCPAVELVVGRQEDDENAIHRLVSQVYDLARDDASLRQEPSRFDDLRAHYPVRREFGHTTVQVTGGSTALRHQLAVLGFKVKQG